MISQGMKNGMIAASIILPIVGIVVGIIYMLDDNPEKKAAGKLWLIIGIVAAVDLDGACPAPSRAAAESMAHDVFISYCSEDKPIADAVCATIPPGRRAPVAGSRRATSFPAWTR